MANGETYPKIGRRIWWLLRERFKKTIPSSVTPTYISSVSEMTDASARANVMAPLRSLGLIDDSDKPTDLAQRWRHDDEYSVVCHEIRQKAYPPELIEAFPEPTVSQRDAVKNWFMKVGKIGEAAAGKLSDTYMLLSEADVSKANEKLASDATPKAARQTAKPKKAPQAAPVEKSPPAPVPPPTPTHPEGGAHKRLPAIHIDVQVHISPDTSPDQIDRIFESMAKHLGGFVK